MRISKDEFYRHGGLSNPKLYRKGGKRGAWRYYRSGV